MTKQYSNMNQHDALYSLARSFPGGIEALAHRLSTPDKTESPNVLRNRLRPDIHTHHTPFEMVSEIIEFAEGANVASSFAPLHAFCWRHNHVAYRLPTADPDVDALLLQVVEVMSEHGDLVNAVREALADKTINEAEFDKIERELEECCVALSVLRAKVRAKHEADCHKVGSHV